MHSDASTADDLRFLEMALDQARRGREEGGVPIGAVLVRDGAVVARGRNRRVQEGSPILHGEMDCLARAGRQRTYRDTTLYTTLAPCWMCSGAILQFGIPRVVVGESRTFAGQLDDLRRHGVEVVVADDPRGHELMQSFLAERPELWAEDIADG